MTVIVYFIFQQHPTLKHNKLDVTGDGTEEVVVCSWDGQTYIVNLDKDVVRFQFREHVAAFYAGFYSLNKENAIIHHKNSYYLDIARRLPEKLSVYLAGRLTI